MTRDPRYKLHKHDFSLELQNIRPNDAGDFVCQVSVFGEAMEVAHTVEVLGTFTCSNIITTDQHIACYHYIFFISNQKLISENE